MDTVNLHGGKITHPSTDWMSRGRFGMMVHWLIPMTAPEHGEVLRHINTAANRFPVERFLKDFASTGADWLIFTFGQNTGQYASPNAILDRLAGPGHCSQRDLVLEIAQGVHQLGKRFIAYLPSEVAGQAEEIKRAFDWNPADQTDFQHCYLQFVREYAMRFGSLIDGWWFDGCYPWPVFPNSTYDWPAWVEAARAGNPQALLAFNDGSFCIGNTEPVTPYQDYLAGETEVLREGKIRLGREDDAPLYLPETRFVPGTPCQWHALVPIDCFWMHGTPGPMEAPRYTDEDLFSFVNHCHAVGGAVTLNVGIYQDGRLGKDSLAQLQRLNSAIAVG